MDAMKMKTMKVKMKALLTLNVNLSHSQTILSAQVTRNTYPGRRAIQPVHERTTVSCKSNECCAKVNYVLPKYADDALTCTDNRMPHTIFVILNFKKEALLTNSM